MTLLEIVNKVLLRLREDTVSATTDSDYATLIAEFVSDMHQEVVQRHDWSSLYDMLDFDTVASQTTYDLSRYTTGTPAGAVVVGTKLAGIGAEPVTSESGLHAWLFEDDTTNIPSRQLLLYRNNNHKVLYNRDRDAVGAPVYLHIGDYGGNGLGASLYPTPDDAYRIRMQIYAPQATLEVDGTDDDTTIAVPWRPIYLGALFMALNERGEEIGEPGNIAERRYMEALDYAIDHDTKPDVMTNRYEAFRD